MKILILFGLCILLVGCQISSLDQIKACYVGCDYSYDELNFRELVGTFENRTISDDLLSQCRFDCRYEFTEEVRVKELLE